MCSFIKYIVIYIDAPYITQQKTGKTFRYFCPNFFFFSLAYHYAAVMDFRFENMLTCGHECFDLYFIAKWGCGRGHLDKLRICHFSWDEISSM